MISWLSEFRFTVKILTGNPKDVKACQVPKVSTLLIASPIIKESRWCKAELTQLGITSFFHSRAHRVSLGAFSLQPRLYLFSAITTNRSRHGRHQDREGPLPRATVALLFSMEGRQTQWGRGFWWRILNLGVNGQDWGIRTVPEKQRSSRMYTCS